METLVKHWRDHGVSCSIWYKKLCQDPSLVPEIEEFMKTYTPMEGIEAYQINHDMSKPYIVEYDSDGKAHYPNHSERSSKMYAALYGEGVVSEMIAHDMDFHTRRGDDLKETWALPFADHLYVSAWAAIFANAEVFGGLESTSFKIKRKALIKAFKHRSKHVEYKKESESILEEEKRTTV